MGARAESERFHTENRVMVCCLGSAHIKKGHRDILVKHNTTLIFTNISWGISILGMKNFSKQR